MVKLLETALAGVRSIMSEPEETTVTESKRIQGKIIKVAAKGYGFISSKDIPFTRIFFHWTSLRPDTVNFKSLRSGMQVSFETLEVEGKGHRAIKIKVEEETKE